jgi:hypothetical protein
MSLNLSRLINPEKLVLGLVNEASEEFAEPLIESGLKEHMTADRRVELGRGLVAAGTALQEGRIRDAAKALAREIGKIKFDIPGL